MLFLIRGQPLVMPQVGAANWQVWPEHNVRCSEIETENSQAPDFRSLVFYDMGLDFYLTCGGIQLKLDR